MSILPKKQLDLSKQAQALVAFLSAVGAVGTTVLHDTAGFLSPNLAAALSSLLATVAAIAGFVRDAEPFINDLDKA